MDNAQIEHELEDLEGRLERLRSLYEQYFMGLEKLEPTVLRKEVDRKMWALRREQIRNTGLRFKFQMLVQRYNTYQQYWTRVVREIESGTYRRDILKVAQRFGEKDALTILGKKRAEQYKRLAKNQLDRRTKRGELFGTEAAAAAAAAPPPDADEVEVALDNDDYELVEDEEQTTPPRGLPAVREGAAPPAAREAAAAPDAREANAAPSARQEKAPPERDEDGGGPDMEALLMFATVGVKDWSARPKPAPPVAPPTREASAAPPTREASAAPATREASAAPTTREASAAAEAAPPSPAPARPEAMPGPATAGGFGEIAIATSPDPAAGSPSAPQPRASSPGGGTSAAAKSRVAELAAQMRAKKDAAKPKVDALDLGDLLDPGPATPKPATPPVNATTRATPPASGASASSTPIPRPPATPSSTPIPKPPATASSTPIPRPPPATASSTPIPRPPATASSTPIPRPPPAELAEPSQQRPATSPFPRPASATSLPGAAAAPSIRSATTAAVSAPAPAPKPAVTAPPAARKDDLSEQKMREIYAKYVGAKRAANESTAGITYDKLASSLRAQAEKIRTTHPTRSVDFEVVTKDGKTALRPIVK